MKSKIRNPKKMRQLIDFKGLELEGGIYPTDIDGLIELRNREYIILEVKHRGAAVPYKPVVAAYCKVREIYYGKEHIWRPPDGSINVRQAIDCFCQYATHKKGG